MINAARALEPRPRPSLMPAAIAITFLAAPAKLDPVNVDASIDAQRVRGEQFLHAPRDGLVARRRDHRGGLAARDFRGERRARQHRQPLHRRRNLGQHRSHRLERIALDALGDADERRVRAERRTDRASSPRAQNATAPPSRPSRSRSPLRPIVRSARSTPAMRRRAGRPRSRAARASPPRDRRAARTRSRDGRRREQARQRAPCPMRRLPKPLSCSFHIKRRIASITEYLFHTTAIRQP